jgi:hypothetical protein
VEVEDGEADANFDKVEIAEENPDASTLLLHRCRQQANTTVPGYIAGDKLVGLHEAHCAAPDDCVSILIIIATRYSPFLPLL